MPPHGWAGVTATAEPKAARIDAELGWTDNDQPGMTRE